MAPHLDGFNQHTVWMAAELKTLAGDQTKLTISCVAPNYIYSYNVMSLI